MAVDLELTETQKLVRDTARAFAQSRIAPGARDRDRHELFPTELLQEMAGLGLMGVNIPASEGGAEAGAVAYALAMMEVAAACASTSVAMSVTNMCAEIISKVGSEAQKQKYVRAITSGQAVAAAFALSEPQCGSDASGIRTSAERRGDQWILNGTKQWITSGAHAGVILVCARTVGEGKRDLSTFLVEKGTPGLFYGRPEEKMGLRGSNTVSLTFEDCAIPVENLLGGEGAGFKLMMSGLDGGRIGIACQACGVARAALAAAIQYAKDRQAFGHPIGDNEAIRFYVADMQTSLEAAELLTLRAAWLKEQGRPFTREASMAKLFASEACNKICDLAVQIHGGYGYIDEFPVERYLRDARVQTIYEGTSEVQRIVIARDLYRALDR